MGRVFLFEIMEWHTFKGESQHPINFEFVEVMARNEGVEVRNIKIDGNKFTAEARKKARLMAFVFTYNREDMIHRLLLDMPDSVDRLVLNDGQRLSTRSTLNCTHTGKKGFWKKWDLALKTAEHLDCDYFLFVPDDFQQIDYNRINAFHEAHKDKPYFCNVINDGRTQQWVRFNERPYNEDFTQIGFVDCGFFCNRSALQKIGFNMTPIDTSRMAGITSSGVGMQLTRRISQAGIPIYKPIKSMAYHGDHDSVMHPEERKKIPLISI